MNKKAIGFKAENSITVVVLMILCGVVLIGGGVLFFAFVMQGAIGGGIAGALIGGGICTVIYGIRSITLPQELVHIDSTTVYLCNKTISINQIQTVTSKGKTLTIQTVEGRKIIQGLLQNSDECRLQILNVIGQQQGVKTADN